MYNKVDIVVPFKVTSLLLLYVLSNCVPDTMSIEMFRMECQDRHFFLAVKSSFLGEVFRFDIEDSSGMHSLSSPQAAECGYTMMLDSQGDLVLRASFLACYVNIHNDSEFQLLLWFVNKKGHEKEASYPLLLTCPLQHPWSPREIVCEENYMEVSVKKQIPPVSQEGMEWIGSPPKESEEEGLREGRVVFRVPDLARKEETQSVSEETLPVGEAHLQGYYISATDTRILLRCGYSSLFSYTLQERGVEVEALSATIFYRHQWMLLMVDASVACTINKATVDGTHVVWTFPQILPPLVQTGYSAWGVGIGVEGHLLSECTIGQRGYKISVHDSIVRVRIPFGAEGGHIKSHVIDNQYTQSYSIDLLYVHQWEDGHQALTQHRSFRPLWSLYVPRTPTLINNTVPSMGMFSVSLGVFPPDVSLSNVTVGGKTMSLVKADQQGLKISQAPFSNGSHAYILQAPFRHPLVSQKYIGGRYRRYTLEVSFTLIISPSGEIYNYPASVVCDLQDVVLPRLEGKCTDRGVQVLLHYGNLDSQWEVYLDSHRLDWELVQLGGYVLEARQDYFSLELPLYSPGTVYEELTLHGLVVRVPVSLVDIEKERVEYTFVQRCTFPVREILVCLPDRRVIVVADTSYIIPPIDPRHTTLLDPSCGPSVTDHTRALFAFSLDSCGTLKTHEESDLVYVNEVRYSPKHRTIPGPLVHPHPPFRFPIGCRYPMKDNTTVAIYHPHVTSSLAPPPHRRTPRSHREGPHGHPFIRGQG